jgi:hypothetical protein
VLLCLVRLAVPMVAPDAGTVGILGGLPGTVAIVLWWAIFSRVPWMERWGAVVLAIAASMPFRP